MEPISKLNRSQIQSLTIDLYNAFALAMTGNV
jgi:hypothetical protein